MFYSYVWIVFCLAAVLCLIMQSVPLLGICFLLVATSMFLYELIRYHRVRLMAILFYVTGLLMAVPQFYTIYVGFIIQGSNPAPADVIITLIALYAILSVADGIFDYVMRRVRCKVQVQAYVFEHNRMRRDGGMNRVHYKSTVYKYSYNGKQYEYEADDMTKEDHPYTRNKNTSILIDKHCPYYIRTSVIQSKNIISIIRGAVILWLFIIIRIRG